MIDANESYNTILDKIIDSIDIYSLGFTLQFIVNSLYKKDAIDVECFTLLTSLFSKMYDFNPRTRVTDLDLLLDEYETILLQTGVLTRLKLNFIDYKLVNKIPLPVSISKSRESPVKLLTYKQEQQAYLDPEQSISCPKGRELNPRTRRCVKKCAEGYIRDDNFKCSKSSKISKTLRFRKSKTVKRCPYGNKKSGKCVKNKRVYINP
jgi:hypothetical protein